MSVAISKPKALVALTMAALMPMQASAFRIDYVAEMTVERNDNLRLDYQDPMSATIFRPGFGFNAQHDGSRVRAQVLGRLDYLVFTGANIDNRLDAALDARVDFSVVPERVGFTIRDTLTQFPLNPFAADSPDNRQRLNVFSSGPNLYFNLPGNASGQVEARHVRTNTDVNDVYDSRRNAGALRVLKPLSETASLTFSVEHQAVEFINNELLQGYDRSDAVVAYQQAFRGGHYVLYGGWSWLSPKGGGEERSSPLLRAELSKQIGMSQNLTLRVARQYSDVALRASSATDFNFNERSGLGDFDVVLNPFPFREDRLEADWTFSGERFSFDVAPYASRIRYELGEFGGHDARGLRLGGAYRATPRLTLGLAGNETRMDYLESDSRVNTRQLAAFADYRISRQVYARMQAGQVTRTDTLLSGGRASQNYVMLTIGYRNH